MDQCCLPVLRYELGTLGGLVWLTVSPSAASLLAAIFLRKVGIVGHRKNMEEESSEQTATEQQSDAEP